MRRGKVAAADVTLGSRDFPSELSFDHGKGDAAMKTLHKTGLPQFDQESFNKGLSDGFRGYKWWPGPATEPLSYAAGYQEGGRSSPRIEAAPGVARVEERA
jgi:hypothetical protein